MLPGTYDVTTREEEVSTTQETYADKIAKLLRKAESTTPEEAELLFAKAQELMAKYAIDDAMVREAMGDKAPNDPLVREEFVMVGLYRYALARMTFLLLHYNDVKVLKLSDPGWRQVGSKVYKENEVYVAVGYKSDIDRCRVLETSLHLQALRAENAWWRENMGLYSGLPKSKQHLARRGFLFAFAEGAGLKIKEATAKGRQVAEEEHGSTSVALVLQSKEIRVQLEFERQFPETRNVKDRKNHGDSWARQHGYAAGKNADVGQPGLKNKERKQLQ